MANFAHKHTHTDLHIVRPADEEFSMRDASFLVTKQLGQCPLDGGRLIKINK